MNLVLFLRINPRIKPIVIKSNTGIIYNNVLNAVIKLAFV
jgi:hypothetical protein